MTRFSSWCLHPQVSRIHKVLYCHSLRYNLRNLWYSAGYLTLLFGVCFKIWVCCGVEISLICPAADALVIRACRTFYAKSALDNISLLVFLQVSILSLVQSGRGIDFVRVLPAIHMSVHSLNWLNLWYLMQLIESDHLTCSNRSIFFLI